jgi:hypothetical protein
MIKQKNPMPIYTELGIPIEVLREESDLRELLRSVRRLLEKRGSALGRKCNEAILRYEWMRRIFPSGTPFAMRSRLSWHSASICAADIATDSLSPRLWIARTACRYSPPP